MRMTRDAAFGVARQLLCVALLSTVPLLTGGCQTFAAMFLAWGPEPTKTVPADYPHLAGKKVAIVIWAEMDTRFEYPFVRYEVAEHVRAAMQGNVQGISFTPNRQVCDLLDRNPEWERKSPAALGARFGADRVLSIELSQYTTREPDSPHLYRGRISAHIKVYDTAEPAAGPTYKTDVDTVYPPDSVGQWGSDDSATRLGVMEVFGRDVAAKFYERKVKLK